MLEYLHVRNKTKKIEPQLFERRLIEIFKSVIESGWIVK
jgi:hypothetical protein